MSYRDRLFDSIEAANELIPLAHALADLDIPYESCVYPELMYFLASKCEAYLDVYYKRKENER